MHISIIKSVQGDKTYYGKLLRKSYRDKNGKSQKITLANLSALDDDAIELLRAHFKGKKLVATDTKNPFVVLNSLSHGHVKAVATAFEKLGIASLLSSRKSPERDLMCAAIAARIIRPSSKLDSVAWWEETTIPEVFSVPRGLKVEALYKDMDWLLKRQKNIQEKLAKRHFSEGCMALYDLSSSYYEGEKGPLAKRGYSRDKKVGKVQINYGLLCDHLGRPISISVYEGNVNDHKTLMTEVKRIQQEFKITEVILVGDRGMMVKADLEKIQAMGNVHWITALRKVSIRKISADNKLEFLKKDEVNMGEIHNHPDYPQERLIACCNKSLQIKLNKKRLSLIAKTEESLREISKRVEKESLKEAKDIGLAVGQVIDRRKVKKYFKLEIEDGKFEFERDEELITVDQAIDGVYIIRTSLSSESMSSAKCVLSYKSLSRVERAFRCLKSDGLKARPIHHRLPDRVRCHFFLCALAYYVEWHMRYAWRNMTYADPDLLENTENRDPVAPAKKQGEALRKSQTHRTQDGERVRKFRSILEGLGTVSHQDCRVNWGVNKSLASESRSTFNMVVGMKPHHSKALALLKEVSYEI